MIYFLQQLEPIALCACKFMLTEDYCYGKYVAIYHSKITIIRIHAIPYLHCQNWNAQSKSIGKIKLHGRINKSVL